MNAPTVGLKLQRHANKEGKRAITLRIRFKIVKAEPEYSTGIFATEEEYKDIANPEGKRRIADHVRRMRLEVYKLIDKAEKIISDTPAVTPELFEILFKGSSSNLETVSGLFDYEIAELEELEQKTGKPNGRRCYVTAKNNIINFFGDVPLQSITVGRLEEYERVHLEKGNAYNTIGQNLRCLRKIFNNAIHRFKKLSIEYYPFGRGGYGIPSEVIENENYLEVDDKDKILSFVSEAATLRTKIEKGVFKGQALRRAKYDLHNEEMLDWSVAMWSLMYYSHGLNPIDFCMMKFSSIAYSAKIGRQEITVYREKSTQRKKVKKSLRVPLHDEAKRILHAYGNKSLNPNDYVLPVLYDGIQAKEIRTRVHAWSTKINKHLKIVSNRLNLKIAVKCYTARHTFAHVVIDSGASTEFLQELLGHAKKETTEFYKHRQGGDGKIVLMHKLGVQRDTAELNEKAG